MNTDKFLRILVGMSFVDPYPIDDYKLHQEKAIKALQELLPAGCVIDMSYPMKPIPENFDEWTAHNYHLIWIGHMLCNAIDKGTCEQTHINLMLSMIRVFQ